MGETLEFGFSDLPGKRVGVHVEAPQAIYERLETSDFGEILENVRQKQVARAIATEETETGRRFIADSRKMGQSTDYDRRLQLRAMFGLVNSLQAVAAVTEYDPSLMVMLGLAREGLFYPVKARIAWGTSKAHNERPIIFERLVGAAADLKLAPSARLVRSTNVVISRRDGVKFTIGQNGGQFTTGPDFQTLRPTYEVSGRARSYEDEFVFLTGAVALASAGRLQQSNQSDKIAE